MLWGYILNHSARSNSQWRIGSKYYVSDILNSPPNFISYWRGVSKYHECYINYPSLLLFPIFTGMGFKISWPQYINPSSDVQCTWGGGSKQNEHDIMNTNPSYFEFLLEMGFKILRLCYIDPPYTSNSNWRGSSKYLYYEILTPTTPFSDCQLFMKRMFKISWPRCFKNPFYFNFQLDKGFNI